MKLQEVWSELSREIGADYQGGGFFSRPKVILSYRQWTITLDIVSDGDIDTPSDYTRMRASYQAADDFRFKIDRRNIFDKLFGNWGIEIGDVSFDNEFIVRSESVGQARRLLANTAIRQLIQKQPNIRLKVKDNAGWFGRASQGDEVELYFQALGEITDKRRLKDLFELFSLVLDELCRLGHMYEAKPEAT